MEPNSVQDHLQSRDGNLAQYCEFRAHLLEQWPSFLIAPFNSIDRGSTEMKFN